MSAKILFKKVKCKGYLKKNCKTVLANDVDAHEEYNDAIKLSYGEGIYQNIYEFREKEFIGVVVGIYWIQSRRMYESVYDDNRNENYVITNGDLPIKVFKVYYANNKSRLVPFEFCDLLEE